jgi:hypothetical protein
MSIETQKTQLDLIQELIEDNLRYIHDTAVRMADLSECVATVSRATVLLQEQFNKLQGELDESRRSERAIEYN